MAYINHLTPAKALEPFFVQIKEHGTPLRVDSETETYYVLTATQLEQLLLSAAVDNVETADSLDEHNFTLEDFGLTEADIAAYEAKQARQRSAFGTQQPRPLSPDVIRRLAALPRLERLFPTHAVAEREELLRELETAMLNNLRAYMAKVE